MKQFPGILIILLLLCGAFSASLPPVIAQPQPPLEPQANVQPNSGTPGTLFRFVATGFIPNERVAVWLNTPDGRAIDADIDDFDGANDIGRADWEWVASLDAQRGTWQMVAQGRQSGVQHVINFTIEGQPAAGQEFNVQPRTAVAGTRFAFFARGFTPGETISTWLVKPNGETIDDDDVRQLNEASSTGRADWYWYSPLDAMPGTWRMVARGDESGNEVVIPFEIVQVVG